MGQFYRSYATVGEFPNPTNPATPWSPFGSTPATPNNLWQGGTGMFARQFPATSATTNDPAVLYWSYLPCIAVNFNDGNGWQILYSPGGVALSLTPTQKQNVLATVIGQGIPGWLVNGMVNNW